MSEEAKEDCVHAKAIDVKDLKRFDKVGSESACAECKEKGDNWVCLTCGSVFCGKDKKDHIAQHCDKQAHPLSFNLSTKSYWCYGCRKEVKSESLKAIEEMLSKPSGGKPMSVSDLFKILMGLSVGEEEDEEGALEITKEQLITNLKAGIYKKVVILTGAGISVNAGIPDFRTPGSGLYSQLEKYKLPFPEAVFEVGFFKSNPEPFYMLAKEMFAKKYVPTKVHYFIKLLQDKGVLLRNYTQNIDNLEVDAGVSKELLIQAHGTYTSSHCTGCKKEVDQMLMMQYMEKGEPYYCEECKVPCKPDIVFFGEGLPKRYGNHISELSTDCDLLIIIGSSMVVMPFCTLPNMVRKSVPRLIINNEELDMFKGKPIKRNVFLQGDCDGAVVELVKLLGWEKEFDKLMIDRANYAAKHKIPLGK